MRYMMFVCVDPAAETYAPEEDNINEWVGEMDRRKVRILGNRLTGVDTATTVRRRSSKVRVRRSRRRRESTARGRPTRSGERDRDARAHRRRMPRAASRAPGPPGNC